MNVQNKPFKERGTKKRKVCKEDDQDLDEDLQLWFSPHKKRDGCWEGFFHQTVENYNVKIKYVFAGM